MIRAVLAVFVLGTLATPARADVLTIHVHLTDETRGMIGAAELAKMKPSAILINTSRGGLVDTRAVIDGLKSGKSGDLGLDVYEEEEELFFEDLSADVIQDDTFMRLLTFPNVLITGHQAFFTSNALEEIARVTAANIAAFEQGAALAFTLGSGVGALQSRQVALDAV